MQARIRAYVYTLVTTVVVLVFAIAEWWAEKAIAERSRFVGIAVEIGIVLFATFLFRPIHERIDKALEAAFTKRRRLAREAVARLRAELTSFKDAGQILRRVTDAVHHHMEATGSATYVRRDVYRAEASSFDTPAENVALDDALVIRLRSNAAPAKPVALRSAAAGTIAFPMTLAGELIGFLSVTPKHGDYEPEDIHELATLAEAMGIALAAIDHELRSHNADNPHNLPTGLPPLIGRDEECAEINALLERSRLVTLSGAGGVGKTRIALHVASQMSRMGDGAWFVDLAPLEDPTLVAGAIAEVFGIPDNGAARGFLDRIALELKSKQLLIVIDNCEHLVASAAIAVGHLLHHCPHVRILTTSREPLGVAGEETYRMPSLPVPPEGEVQTIETLARYGAAVLFVTRAQTAQRTFALTDDNAPIVADIVRRLDGIALAIELAASRAKILSVEQLTQRLDERFKVLSGGSRTARPRHQTLRALIGWSYDLLTPAEQYVLRRCAIFRGSWTLEAIEAMCDDPAHADLNALDLLAALVDKSLIVVQDESGDRRYRLLESTREYAAERLDEASERADVAALHCAYFARAAERAIGAHWQTDADEWVAYARRDLENYRAAITWGLSGDGDASLAATIVANLRWLWYVTSRREGRVLLERIHTVSLDHAPPLTHARLALTSAAIENSAHSAAPAREALLALRGGVDPQGYIEALAFLGSALGRAGHAADAIRTLEEAASEARALRLPRLIGWVISSAAYWAGVAEDAVRARALFAEAESILRGCADTWQLARMNVNRAEFLFSENDFTGALASGRDACDVFRKRNARIGICSAMLNMTGYLFALRRLDDAADCAREGLELAVQFDDAIQILNGIGHFARYAVETGDVERATRLLGFADASYEDMQVVRQPTEQYGYDRSIELIQASLSDEQMRALMTQGATMTTEAAVTEAFAAATQHQARTA